MSKSTDFPFGHNVAKKHYRVYIGYQCCVRVEFEAYAATIVDGFMLLVDGIKFTNGDGFYGLEEGWIN